MIQIAVAGPGRISRRFLDGMKDVSDGCVCAFATRNPDRVREYAETYQIQQTGSFDALCRDSSIHGFYVSTPNHVHYEMIRQALLSGKHVICEKPITVTGKELRELFELDSTYAEYDKVGARIIAAGNDATITTDDSMTSVTVNTYGDATITADVFITGLTVSTLMGDVKVASDEITNSDIYTYVGDVTVTTDTYGISGLTVKSSGDATVTSAADIVNSTINALYTATVSAEKGRISAIDVSATDIVVTADQTISGSNLAAKNTVYVESYNGELDGLTVTADGEAIAATEDAITGIGTWIVGGEYVAENGNVVLTATVGSVVGAIAVAKNGESNVTVTAEEGELDDITVAAIGDIIITAEGITAGAYISEEGNIELTSTGEDISGVYAKAKKGHVEITTTGESLDIIDTTADAHLYATLTATGAPVRHAERHRLRPELEGRQRHRIRGRHRGRCHLRHDPRGRQLRDARSGRRHRERHGRRERRRPREPRRQGDRDPRRLRRHGLQLHRQLRLLQPERRHLDD